MSISMEDEVKTEKYEEETISWQIDEYEKHLRTKRWYITAICMALFFLIFSFFTGNFLFAVIIIIVSLVTILHDGQNPKRITIALAEEGVIVGQKMHDYDEIKNFSVIYKPSQKIKRLYFEFKNIITPRLSIPLEDMNPLPIREFLLKYLPEDLERTDEPLSEGLARILKL